MQVTCLSMQIFRSRWFLHSFFLWAIVFWLHTVRLMKRIILHGYCTLVSKIVFHRDMVSNSESILRYWRFEEISKYMVWERRCVILWMRTSSTQILVSKHHSSIKEICVPEWLIQELDHKKYQISLEHLVVPEKKRCFKSDGEWRKDTGAKLKIGHMAKSGHFEQQNKY